MSSLEKGQQWHRVFDFLDTMEVNGSVANMITYNAAISSCGQRWWEALNFFVRSRGSHNVISYSAMLKSCENGQWQLALEFLQRMKKEQLLPNLLTCNALICSCERGSQWQAALEIFHSMEVQGVSPDILTLSTAFSCCQMGFRPAFLTTLAGKAFSLLRSERRARIVSGDLEEADLRGLPSAVPFCFRPRQPGWPCARVFGATRST